MDLLELHPNDLSWQMPVDNLPLDVRKICVEDVFLLYRPDFQALHRYQSDCIQRCTSKSKWSTTYRRQPSLPATLSLGYNEKQD